MRTAQQTYDFYANKSHQLTEKYRKLIFDAHPEVGMDTAFHHAHNWGNNAASALLETYSRKSHALNKRGYREYWRAEHESHAQSLYVWCEYCAKIRGDE